MYRLEFFILARGTISRYAPAGTGLPHDNRHERRHTGHQASSFILGWPGLRRAVFGGLIINQAAFPGLAKSSTQG